MSLCPQYSCAFAVLSSDFTVCCPGAYALAMKEILYGSYQCITAEIKPETAGLIPCWCQQLQLLAVRWYETHFKYSDVHVLVLTAINVKVMPTILAKQSLPSIFVSPPGVCRCSGSCYVGCRADVYDRMTIFEDHMIRDINAGRFRDNTSLVLLTHGLALRVFLMRWFHWTVDQFMNVYNPPNAEVSLLHYITSCMSCHVVSCCGMAFVLLILLLDSGYVQGLL